MRSKPVESEAMVSSGAMREDFFYRLKGVVLRTPALVDRREDIAPLAVHFLAQTPPRWSRTLRPMTLT
jgi:two-component system NtrC family response regulator